MGGGESSRQTLIDQVLEVFYIRIGIPIAIIFGTIGLFCVPYGLFQGSTDPTSGGALLPASAIVVLGALFLSTGIFILIIRRSLLRLREAQGNIRQPDLLGAGVLSFDFIDWKRLLDIATQASVDLQPVTSERSSGTKRTSAKAAIRIIEAARAREQTTDQKDIYEIPRNPSQVLREVVTKLNSGGHLHSRLDQIPTVEVSSPVDQKILREVLLRICRQRLAELAPRQAGAMSLEAFLAEIEAIAEETARELTTRRLADAKKQEFREVHSNAFVLVQSEWTVTSSDTRYELKLAKLWSRGDPQRRNVDMPSDLNLAVLIEKAELEARGKRRLEVSPVAASIFGEVLDKSNDATALTIWPVVVFSRSDL